MCYIKNEKRKKTNNRIIDQQIKKKLERSEKYKITSTWE